ncbi:LysR substrate-binding domain-containing protein [Bartonella sp. HY329]|uniref:LysR family transcriptional regulator n=1 Tax=unclassified Bartonella TaxID=2645622 RepID=UPI0021C76724|nr:MULTISPECIES: LysR family transcriptional regulator [unclassified Bartonella]UXM94263.1 LysR substrate-binding domain-containing protein [Bartonella sp. HY329]UXN08586.1 LysR substrate-binding domain-containing protein [Bartonella sp. HY328]
MHTRSLKALIEVVRLNSFSAAALAMNATQSTISKAISQLETFYDVTLLERGKNGVRLTAIGKRVYQHALRILAEEDAILREVADMKGMKRGLLRIGLPPIGSSVLFAPVLAQYTAQHPNIDIEIVEHGGKKLEEMVRHGDLELAATLVPTTKGFNYQEVRNEPLVALMSDSAAAGRKKASLAELAVHPFILFESQFALTPIVLDACKEVGIAPKISAKSSQIDFIFGLVAADMGVGFLPKMIAEARPYPGIQHIEIEDHPIAWHMVILWRENAHLSDAANAWLQLSKKFHNN